nr:helix-turn-helix domain-containing protein [Shimia sp. R11_0]
MQKYSAPALEKGLDILELLSLQAGGALSHAEIAKGIGRSKNEIFRMMVVLEERGYIERGADDDFKLSAKVGALSASVNDEVKMRGIAQPFLSRLSEETGLTNHLWVIVGDAMRVALSSGAEGSYSLKLNEGEKGELFMTSAGACFLSALETSSDQMRLLHSLGEYVPDNEFSAFWQDIEDCRQQGFSAKPSRQAYGILEISAPVRIGSSTDVIGAVTVPIIGARHQDNEISKVTDRLLDVVGALNARLSLLASAGFTKMGAQG